MYWKKEIIKINNNIIDLIKFKLIINKISHLTRSIGLFSYEKIEEGKFVDVIVQVNISIRGHGRVRFLRNACYFLLPQSSNIKKRSEK